MRFSSRAAGVSVLRGAGQQQSFRASAPACHMADKERPGGHRSPLQRGCAHDFDSSQSGHFIRTDDQDTQPKRAAKSHSRTQEVREPQSVRLWQQQTRSTDIVSMASPRHAFCEEGTLQRTPSCRRSCDFYQQKLRLRRRTSAFPWCSCKQQ